MVSLNPVQTNNNLANPFKFFAIGQIVGVLAGSIVLLSLGIPISPNVPHILAYITCLINVPMAVQNID